MSSDAVDAFLSVYTQQHFHIHIYIYISFTMIRFLCLVHFLATFFFSNLVQFRLKKDSTTTFITAIYIPLLLLLSCHL